MFDEKDKLLLRELLKDGRQPITELAKKCGMTRQSIYARIKELRKKGIKFTIDIDPNVIGLKIKAYILIIAEPQTEFRKETDKIIKTFKEISQIHYLLGRFDIIVEVVVRNIDELRGVLRRIQSLPAVKKTETLMVYETTKFDPKDPIRKLLE
jgi:Lrp/AsnC family leucine-responsive transcriptional regulator